MPPPTILHVEDDPALADIVESSFHGFGFHGVTLKAETVVQAVEVLDDVARRGEVIDLIISDMSLPDGTGLEVVHYVRRNPAWEHTPILILSADGDASKITRAYALGANSYISKSPRGRSMSHVIKTLYDHWLRDVSLPHATPPDRTTQFLARAITIRSRCAADYVRMAERFGDSPSEVAFWLSRALSESNLVNLITFVKDQIGERVLPPDLLDEAERVQQESERRIAAFERELETRPVDTHDESYRLMLDLVSIFAGPSNVQLFARSVGHLFPVSPVAIEALLDLMARNFDDVAAWIDIHSADATLHDRTASLRAAAGFLRTLAVTERA